MFKFKEVKDMVRFLFEIVIFHFPVDYTLFLTLGQVGSCSKCFQLLPHLTQFFAQQTNFPSKNLSLYVCLCLPSQGPGPGLSARGCVICPGLESLKHPPAVSAAGLKVSMSLTQVNETSKNRFLPEEF